MSIHAWIRSLLLLCLLSSALAGGFATEENITGILSGDPALVLERFENGSFKEPDLNTLIEIQDLLYRKLALGLAGKGEYEKAITVLDSIPSHELTYDSILLLAFLHNRVQDHQAALNHIITLQARYPDVSQAVPINVPFPGCPVDHPMSPHLITRGPMETRRGTTC